MVMVMVVVGLVVVGGGGNSHDDRLMTFHVSLIYLNKSEADGDAGVVWLVPGELLWKLHT